MVYSNESFFDWAYFIFWLGDVNACKWRLL